ncbi:ABC transporter substrate-binding protein [Pelagicoccus sp. NFK12]|uniref:ABC transporter substrate-binding protein n=1 Tax=Pelagicoccus enzymogenes TaxID=2773457 RepID=A0A927F9J9_9BACT|nr:ABC transporter substrate-binding protein [Pelagicoccus enzymogenes]MBD5779675.1 ABC transporter substrate-binding protein [Pelagicoccus enzymogenes]MDQ8199305.1 ABC transporter substrate-binding protein [Pelagicoccus enzymogenes]
MKTFLICILSCLSVSAWASEVRYAKNFSIEVLDTHKEITVRNTWKGAGDREQVYALVPRKSALPKLDKGTIVIRTPVERLAIMATVFLGPIRDLDLYDSLVGIAYLDYANDEKAHQLVDSGAARRIQSGTAMDVESMLMLQPDLILTSTTGNPTFDVHPQMLRAGLPVVVTAGYMEAHPLARTEWIKFVAAFYDKEEEAERIFSQIAERYEALVALAKNTKERPTVFASAPYSGVWHVPGGQSYSATAFMHAGADYLWADNPSKGGVPLDVEVILKRAAKADFWLNPSHYDSIRGLLSADERFAAFEALQKGRVYNNTVRVNENGGNDIFERGVSHPEEVLADLIKIFHPELVPDHEFVFYERLK